MCSPNALCHALKRRNPQLPPWPTLDSPHETERSRSLYKFVVSDGVSVHHRGRLTCPCPSSSDTCPCPSSSDTCPFRPSRSPTSSSASARASPCAVRPVWPQQPRQRQV